MCLLHSYENLVQQVRLSSKVNIYSPPLACESPFLVQENIKEIKDFLSRYFRENRDPISNSLIDGAKNSCITDAIFIAYLIQKHFFLFIDLLIDIFVMVFILALFYYGENSAGRRRHLKCKEDDRDIAIFFHCFSTFAFLI